MKLKKEFSDFFTRIRIDINVLETLKEFGLNSKQEKPD